MYQLSRLLHDYHRDLYNHLEENEISPSLYAAPWFLTLFASQFPLGFVARVFGKNDYSLAIINRMTLFIVFWNSKGIVFYILMVFGVTCGCQVAILLLLGCHFHFEEENQMYSFKHQTWTIDYLLLLVRIWEKKKSLWWMPFVHLVFSQICRKVHLVKLANWTSALWRRKRMYWFSRKYVWKASDK